MKRRLMLVTMLSAAVAAVAKPMKARGSRSSALDAATADWVARVQATGASPSGTATTAVDTMIQGLKADGTFALITEMTVFAGVPAIANIVPIISASGATITATNFTSADYISSGPDCGLNDYDQGRYLASYGGETLKTLTAGTPTWAQNSAYIVFGMGRNAGSPVFANTAGSAFPYLYGDGANGSSVGLYGFGANEFLQDTTHRPVGDMIFVRESATLKRLTIGDFTPITLTGSSSSSPTAGGTLRLKNGSSALGGGWQMAGYCIAPGATAAQAVSIRSRMRTMFAALGRTNGITTFVYEGDSITWGTGVGVNGYDQRLKTLAGWSGRHVNTARNSETTAGMRTQYATQVQPFRPDGYYSTRGLLFHWSGTNDLYAGTATATIFASLQAQWAAARADGFKVIAFTVAPRGDVNGVGGAATTWTAGMETERNALNALIIADSANYDALIRVDTLFPTPSDTTYFQADRLHLNQAGENLLADTIFAQINPATVGDVAANAIVPDAPLRDTLTGGSGQFTITWTAVERLVSGAAISTDPVTLYTVRWGTTRASVLEGGTPTGSTTTASLTATRTGLAAGTWYVSISATNGAGESSYSFGYSVTVT